MRSLNSGLRRVNPVAKLAATMPAILALFVTRGVFAPTVFLGLVVLTLLAFGAIGARRLGLLVAFILLWAVAGTILMGLWIDPRDSTVWWHWGPMVCSMLGITTAAATTLRILAIIALVLLPGFTTTAQDLLLSIQQQLRVPYRYVHAGRAALVILPSVTDTFRIIRLAHKVRDTIASRGPMGWIRGQATMVVPVMAGAIRTGERLALAMDARGFGASRTRTERRILRWRPNDTAVTVGGLLITVAIYAIGFQQGLLGTVSLW